MSQTMVLMGVLAICAVSGALLNYRSRWKPGPDEPPTGSYTAPTPPVPSPPPTLAAPTPPPATAAAPGKPSQPLPATLSVPPAPAAPAPVAVPPATVPPVTVSTVRRGRNSGFARFAPAPVRTRTGRA